MNMAMISANGWLQITLYFVVLFVCVKPLGIYMAKVFAGEKTFMSPVLGWLERGFYRIAGIDPSEEMGWKEYACALLAFSFLSFLALYGLLRFQNALPVNPGRMAALPPDLAFNTAVSFITNTNWQAYAGESTMSHLSQMVGLTVQNFLSAGIGMAVLMTLIRGFTRRNAATVGNFWADLVRGVLYILLPLALILAPLLVSQGVVQSLSPAIVANHDKDIKPVEQLIFLGPVASQVAIKQLGTNGGGFFGANAAHPFENPTPLSNFLQMLTILLIPASLCITFGRMVGNVRQGWVLLAAMTFIFVPFMLFGVFNEQAGNAKFSILNKDQATITLLSSGNMEGKEARFGIINSALWSAVTTAAANGSTNAAQDSFTPLAGLVSMAFIQFGEVIFGGVGTGLCGMLIFVMFTVFIAGLMVGRTPEYLGKKINAFDIKMASLAVLAPHLAALIGAAIAVMFQGGQPAAGNPGAQGFSEILYAFSSAANNNGSSFAGLSPNTPFYNTAIGLAMIFGRYFVMIPMLALAGSLASKNAVPRSAGTLQTTTPLFVFLLVSVVVMVGVLAFVPSLALGPIAEHFTMIGRGAM